MPFANLKNEKVFLKMELKNEKHSKGLSRVDGDQWYKEETVKAVN
jgi:hypothetical protein